MKARMRFGVFMPKLSPIQTVMGSDLRRAKNEKLTIHIDSTSLKRGFYAIVL
jgi:hypothetical protein